MYLKKSGHMKSFVEKGKKHEEEWKALWDL